MLPWLFFSLGIRRAYEPFYGALAYRSFFHPLAELEGFLSCFAVGLLFTLLAPAPRAWQWLLALAAPVASALLGAFGRWQAGVAAELLLLLVALEFAVRRVRLTAGALWIGYGLAMGAAGALLARSDASYELGRDLVMQGLFSGIAIGVARMLRSDGRERLWVHALFGTAFAASFFLRAQHLGFALRGLACIGAALPLRPSFEFGPANVRRGLAHLALWILPLGNAWIAIALPVRRAGLHAIFLGSFAALLLAAFTAARGARLLLAGTAALFALAMLARAMVELDPTSFHLWMGVSSASFLCASAACVLLSTKLPYGVPTQARPRPFEAPSGGVMMP